MKLAVIGGAGLLGSTTAFYTGCRGILSEIKLIDLNKNLMMSHVMDMGQALSTISKTVVTAADYSDIGDCDIIFLSASLPERNVASRNEYLQGNLSIVENVCKELKKYCDSKVVISATNPIDVFNYITWRKLGWNRKRFIGFSINDTVRMKWSLTKLLNLDYDKIDAHCIGEHGDGQIPLFDQALVDGKPLELSPSQRQEAANIVSNWFKEYQGLQSGRTSGWTSAIGVTSIIEAIVTGGSAPVSCSAVLEGEYGYENISIGVPCMLGPDGIEEIINIDLTNAQKEDFKKSAEKIKGLISSIGY